MYEVLIAGKITTTVTERNNIFIKKEKRMIHIERHGRLLGWGAGVIRQSEYAEETMGRDRS